MQNDESEDVLDVFMAEFRDLKDWIDTGKRPKDFKGALPAMEDAVRNRLAMQRININLPAGFKEAWAEYQTNYSDEFKILDWSETGAGRSDQPKQRFFNEWLDGLVNAENYDDISAVMQMGTGYADLSKSFWRWSALEEISPVVPQYVEAENYGRHYIFMLLQQAHRAIVFGAPFAAIASMRAALEDLLCNWLKVPGKDLYEMLNDKTVLKLSKSSEERLHNLRKRANAALHIGIGRRTTDEEDRYKEERDFVANMNLMAAGELDNLGEAELMMEFNEMLSEIKSLVEKLET